MKRTLKGFLFLLLAVTGILLIIILTAGSDWLLECISGITGVPKSNSKLLALVRWETIAGISMLLVLFAVLLLYIIYRYGFFYRTLRKLSISTGHSIMLRYHRDYRDGMLILLLIPLCTIIYYAYIMPVGYDEAWTFLNFTSRSIFTSISYYPAPNNHILHSILTNIFFFLPFPELANLRIPVILVQLINLLLFYSLVKEYFGREIALIALAFFSTFFMTLYYSYMSRGYALQAFSFLLLTYSVFKLLKHPERNLYWFWFTVAGITGFYSVPSFLYPFLLTSLYLVITWKKITRPFFIAGIAIVSVTFFLYLPVIIVSGLDSLLHVKDMMPVSRMEAITLMPEYLETMLFEITGIPALPVFIIMLAGMGIMLWYHRSVYTRYIVFFIILSPVLLMLHGVIPFARTFYFWSVLVSVSFAFLGARLWRWNTESGIFIAILMVVQLGLALNYDQCVKSREKHSIAAEEEMVKIRKGCSFLVCSNLFDTYLRFDLYIKKRLNCIVDYRNPGNIDLDTLANRDRYDYIIIDTDFDRTKHLTPLSENPTYHLYVKK